MNVAISPLRATCLSTSLQTTLLLNHLNWIHIIILLFSLAGGLISFNIRYGELEKFQPKMEELEKAGNWENVVKETLPQFETDDMPKTSSFFAYKVLKY